jgi:hypothetical protein
MYGLLLTVPVLFLGERLLADAVTWLASRLARIEVMINGPTLFRRPGNRYVFE